MAAVSLGPEGSATAAPSADAAAEDTAPEVAASRNHFKVWF